MILKNNTNTTTRNGRYNMNHYNRSKEQWKRFTVFFAAIMVLFSLLGTIQIICHMEPYDEWKGWILLCFGVTMLLPIAIIINQFIQTCWNINKMNTFKNGIVIKRTTTNLCHNTDNGNDNCSTISNNNTIVPNINIDAAVHNNDGTADFLTMSNACHELYDICEHFPSKNNQKTTTTTENTTTAKERQKAAFHNKDNRQYSSSSLSNHNNNTSTSTTGCYFVRYPTSKRNRHNNTKKENQKSLSLLHNQHNLDDDIDNSNQYNVSSDNIKTTTKGRNNHDQQLHGNNNHLYRKESATGSKGSNRTQNASNRGQFNHDEDGLTSSSISSSNNSISSVSSISLCDRSDIVFPTLMNHHRIHHGMMMMQNNNSHYHNQTSEETL